MSLCGGAEGRRQKESRKISSSCFCEPYTTATLLLFRNVNNVSVFREFDPRGEWSRASTIIFEFLFQCETWHGCTNSLKFHINLLLDCWAIVWTLWWLFEQFTVCLRTHHIQWWYVRVVLRLSFMFNELSTISWNLISIDRSCRDDDEVSQLFRRDSRRWEIYDELSRLLWCSS